MPRAERPSPAVLDVVAAELRVPTPRPTTDSSPDDHLRRALALVELSRLVLDAD